MRIYSSTCWHILTALLIIGASVFSQQTPPEPRIALIMGVGDYGGTKFPTLPGIDVDLKHMEAALKTTGFQVTVVLNPTLSAAEEAIESFGAKLKTQAGGVGVFYFSGHGGEFEGKNYLIPKGARISGARDIKEQAVAAQRVLNRMEDAGARVNVVFLDCCRNDLTKAATDTGLAAMTAKGTFIGFATGTNKTSAASTAGSPYTTFLAQRLLTPGISILDMHTQVTADVEDFTKANGVEQTPFQYSGLRSSFFFVPGQAKNREIEEEIQRRVKAEMAKLTPSKPIVATPSQRPKVENATPLSPALGATLTHPEKKTLTLNLFCWSEYVPQSVIDGFTKETGIKVNVENYDSNEAMISKLLAGGGKYDLIQPSEYMIDALIKAGKLEEIIFANVPNIKNLDPKFAKTAFDPEGKYSVAWMAGTVGIVVNTTKVKTPVTGCKDVFDGTHKRRIVVVNDSREIVSWALASLGISANDTTPENLEKVKPILAEWLPQVKVYDSDSPKTALLNGDVDLGIVWSGEAAILWSKDKKFAYVLPAEGAHQFIDCLAIPKGAANKENAEKFINYILKPEVSVLISDVFPYTNPNAEAVKLLKPAQRENLASYPPGKPRLVTFRYIGRSTQDIDKLVSQVKSATR